MMGRQSRQMAMLFVDMESLIPENHLLRKIDRLISFDFIYDFLAPYYPATGRPSVDPVSMFKMLLIGYLYGIKSERRLVEEVQLNIAYRWFCGFELNDTIPDHSTFSKTRTRKWQQSNLFQKAFYEIVKQCIVNPTYYWRSKGTSRGGSKSTLEPTKWGHTTIKKILTTQEYCGDVINFKSYSKSYKMKKRIENPEENRAIFLNVHEAIIDRPTWEKVQALKAGTRRKRPTVTQEPSVFSGVMKCPECGGNLNFHFNQNNHDIKFFSCQNHNSGLRKCSSTHYIRLDFLEQVVLYEVHRLACFANEYENDFIKAMVGRSAKVAENERVRKKRELDALLARDRELDTLFERLYEDNVSGKIDDARFAKMAKRYEQEQGENAGRIKTLRLEVKKLDEKRMDVDDFLETVRRYTDATKITKRMVAELIDHIEVYPAVKEDGVTNQRVTIHYNCIGVFEVPDRRKIPKRDILLETRRGVALSYAPEQVAV